MRYLLIVLFTLFITSCATNGHYNNSNGTFRGQTVQQLTSTWGQPDSITSAPNGNKYYTYRTEVFQSVPAPATGNIPTTIKAGGRPVVVSVPTPAVDPTLTVKKCVYQFEVDKHGTVVDGKATGTKCTLVMG